MNENRKQELEYVGFWARFGASIIDGIFLGIILLLVTVLLEYHAKLTDNYIELINCIACLVITILFWIKKQATPGKMIISSKIVDAETGEKPSNGQFIGRYFGYILSAIPFCLGYIWIAFDNRKQGWHDKLAGTVVVRSKH